MLVPRSRQPRGPGDDKSQRISHFATVHPVHPIHTYYINPFSLATLKYARTSARMYVRIYVQSAGRSSKLRQVKRLSRSTLGQHWRGPRGPQEI